MSQPKSSVEAVAQLQPPLQFSSKMSRCFGFYMLVESQLVHHRLRWQRTPVLAGREGAFILPINNKKQAKTRAVGHVVPG